MHKKTRVAIKLAIPLFILGYLFYTRDLSELKVHILQTNPWIFFVSFLLLCIRNIIGAFRSRVLLNYKKLSYPLTVLAKYYFIGNFFYLVFLEILVRDHARGYYLYNSSEEKKEAISSIVVERFIGTASLMFLSILSVLGAGFLGLNVLHNNIIKIIFVTFLLSCLFVILFFYERTDRFFKRLIPATASSKIKTLVEFISEVITYNKAPSVLWYTFSISLLFQFIGVIATYLVALSINSTVPFIYFMILLPVVWFIGMIPVSIGGIGVREGSLVLLFSTVGMTDEMGIAIGLLWFVQNLGLGLIGGVLFYLEGKDRNSS